MKNTSFLAAFLLVPVMGLATDYEAIAYEAKSKAVNKITPYLQESNFANQKLEDLKVHSNNELSEYKNIALQANKDESKIIRQYLPLITQYRSAPVKQSNIESQLIIFVSLSMPESSLVPLLEQANKVGGRVVICGLKNDSFKETVNSIAELVHKAKVGGIAIDPKAFAQYGVEVVPTFILKGQGSQLSYDKLSGNLSIDGALHEFATRGDNANKAQQLLEKFTKDNHA